MTSRHISQVMFCRVPSRVMPALLTSTSIGPCAASMRRQPSWQAAKSATFQR